MISAGGATVRSDMIVMPEGILHPAEAHRAVFPVVVDTGVFIGRKRLPVHSEADGVLPPPGKQRDKRVVRIDDEPAAFRNTFLNRVVHPLRMTVSCQLVAVEVGYDVMRRLHVLKGVLCIPFVRFDKKYVLPEPPGERTAAEYQRSHALDLIRALAVIGKALSRGGQNMRNHLDR